MTIRQRNRKNPWTLGILFIFMTGCFLISGCSLHPRVLEKEQVWNEVQSDMDILSSDQEPIEHPVTLHEAMARAIKYNRERRLKLMQSALAMRQRDLSVFDLLPNLTATSGYTGRNRVAASSSESYSTGNESLESSISQDRYRSTGDVSFTWSILDFGLSYVRARQQSDRYLMVREVERKTVQNIVSDVRLAWWQALSAQRMLGRIDPLMGQVEKALETSRSIEGQRLDAPLKALTYQRGLLDMMRTLEILRQELNLAKPRLASLMGLSFNQDFTLADPEEERVDFEIAWDVAMMEKIALLSRPELMESRYQNRISSEQTRAAILGLLPNLNLNAGWNWDSNSYLVNNSWFNFGSQVSWNLLRIFGAPAAVRAARTEEEVSNQRRLAMSMTVLMQVHLAKANYLQARRRFNVEDTASSVEDRILEQLYSANAAESEGRQTLIRGQLNELLAQVRRDKAYAELQNSFGRMLVSMGVDPVPAELDSISVQALSRAIEECMTGWQASALDEVSGLSSFLPESLVAASLAGSSMNADEVRTVPSAPVENDVKEASETAETAETEKATAPNGPGIKDETVVTEEPSEEAKASIPETVTVLEVKGPTKEPLEERSNMERDAGEVISDDMTAEKASVARKSSRASVTASHLAVRLKPGLDGGVIMRSSFNGEEFPLLDRRNGWVKLDLDGTVGWISDSYVTVIIE